VRHRGGKLREPEVDARAYLRTILNVLPGIISRTKIIRFLEGDWKSATKISRETGLSYKVVTYHLHLMEKERIVTSKGKRPKLWELTGFGQQRIMEPSTRKDKYVNG
jgi:predicted transcriptional regulator